MKDFIFIVETLSCKSQFFYDIVNKLVDNMKKEKKFDTYTYQQKYCTNDVYQECCKAKYTSDNMYNIIEILTDDFILDNYIDDKKSFKYILQLYKLYWDFKRLSKKLKKHIKF